LGEERQEAGHERCRTSHQMAARGRVLLIETQRALDRRQSRRCDLPFSEHRARAAWALLELDEAVDAVVGEGHDAFVEVPHPDDAVLGLHFDGHVEKEADVFAKVFGDAVNGLRSFRAKFPLLMRDRQRHAP
jgi:hypothetical protein